MWIFMNNSFLSIVENTDNKNELLVRARRKGDIERVFPGFNAEYTPHNDYPYRVFIPRDKVSTVLSQKVEEISYPNFKGSVNDTGRERRYMEVWSCMSDFR